MKQDWILTSWWIINYLYAVMTGASWIALYLSFSWKLTIISWFCTAMVLFSMNRVMRRAQYVAEVELLKQISEKLREVK